MVRRLVPYLLPLAISAVLGAWCTTRILERAASPALPLDDSFIHLQYAKRLAAGHWFSFTPGGGYSSGATSMLWPLAIAPWMALGLRGLDVVYVVWAMGSVLHAAVALETARVAARLGGRFTGLAAGAACFAFGAFTWFAYSGMETIALTWILMRGVRVAAERAEPDAERPFSLAPPASASAVAITGLCAPLVRPEGAVISVIAALVMLREVRRAGPLASRLAHVALPALGPLVIPSLHRWFTGHSASATAMVKWLALDPYLSREELVDATLANVELLLTDLLNGGRWTSLFVPEDMAVPLALGVLALGVAAWRHERPWSAAFVALVVLATLGPCSYSTILWNRVRYIWPFAPAWFVAILVLTHEIGELFGRRLHPKAAAVGAVLSFGAVAPLAVKLPDAVADVATSARAIHRQQVTLGMWAHDQLPADAVIGVNDTGAIAYFSERKTFDVVGLTTEGEAPYWAEGPGSRFEHYERLGPERLPTHFIVYPGWMGMDAVLGDWLTEASVYDQSILGGVKKVAYEARYDLLGSGAAPLVKRAWGALLDEVDVADLPSERAHHYLRSDARSRFNVTRVDHDPLGGVEMADGGRMQRAEDQFVLKEGPPSVLVMRVRCAHDVVVHSGSEKVGAAELTLEREPWDELTIDLPASSTTRWVTVRCENTAENRLERFDTYHYWLYTRPRL